MRNQVHQINVAVLSLLKQQINAPSCPPSNALSRPDDLEIFVEQN